MERKWTNRRGGLNEQLWGFGSELLGGSIETCPSTGIRQWKNCDNYGRPDPCSLLAKVLPRIGEYLVEDRTDVVSVDVEDGRTEKMLIDGLGVENVSTYYPVAPRISALNAALGAVSKLDVETRAVGGTAAGLAEMPQLWNRPALLCMLDGRFPLEQTDRLMTAVARKVGEGGLFLFTFDLRSSFPQTGAGYSSPHYELRHTIPWSRNSHDRREESFFPTQADLPIRGADTSGIRDTFTTPACRLEHTLRRYGFNILELSVCRSHCHAVVLARRSPSIVCSARMFPAAYN